MMMSSESFYEENLKGWSTEEISAQIDGLRREIAELKAALRSPDNYSEPQIMPSNDVRLAMALDYFDVAKTAFIAAGGKFSPTDDENKAIEFDSKLDSLTDINLTIESFFRGDENLYSNCFRKPRRRYAQAFSATRQRAKTKL